MDKMKEEFYIGWQDKASEWYVQKIRQSLWIMLLLVIGVSALLTLNQKPFSASTFEITKLRTLEGILIKSPIPCLKIPTGIDHKGIQQFQRVLLIGFGKKSAMPTLETIEKAQKQILDGKPVKLEGKLIYFDGVLAIELTEGLNTFKGFSDIKDAPSSQQTLGTVTLRGEILDPKCYLGVMRPGEGKPHRSCAIRCILGGIPPFFKAATKDDDRQYFFILDANGHAWHQEIAHYVADEVQLCGMVEKWDDWYVIKIANSADIQRIKWHWAKHIPMCATN